MNESLGCEQGLEMWKTTFLLIAVAGVGLFYGAALRGGLGPVVTVRTPCKAVSRVHVSLRPAKEYLVLCYSAPSAVDAAMPIRRPPEGTDFRMPMRDLLIQNGSGLCTNGKKENKVLEFPVPRK